MVCPMKWFDYIYGKWKTTLMNYHMFSGKDGDFKIENKQMMFIQWNYLILSNEIVCLS